MNIPTSDKKIASEFDKTGSPVTVFLASTIGESPVLPIFLREYANLIDAGYAQYSMVGNNRNKSVYAVMDNKIVAIMVYEIGEDITKTTWINFSFVDEKFRGRGIFKILHKCLEDCVKTAGSKKISSLIHIDNTTMLASAKSVGRLPVFYRTEKRI